MPRAGRRGIVGAIGGVPGWIDRRYFPFASYGGGDWVDDDTLIVVDARSGGTTKLWRPYDDPDAVSMLDAWNPPSIANAVSGGGGRYLAWAGYPSGSVLYGALGAIPYAGFGDVAEDGTIAFKTVYQSDHGITIVPPDAPGRYDPTRPNDLPTGWIRLDAPSGIDLRALPGGQATWRGGAYGRPAPRPFYADAMGLMVLRVADEDWLLYWSNARPGLVLQLDGGDHGYVLDEVGEAFNHDAFGGADRATIAFSRTQGEAPGDLCVLLANRDGVTVARDAAGQVLDWQVDGLGHSTRAPIRWQALDYPLVLPTIDRPLWLGWFEFEQSRRGPGNAALLVRNASGAQDRAVIVTDETVGRVSGRVVGHYVSGATVEEVEAAARRVAAGGVVPVAYWDGRRWPRLPSLPPGAWIAQQAYCGAAEDLATFEGAIDHELRRFPADAKLAIVGQQYTSNASLAGYVDPTSPSPHDSHGIRPLIPVLLRLAARFPNVVALLPFSGYDRRGGLVDHPDLVAPWQQVANGLRTPPPEAAANPPRVTIARWAPTSGPAPLTVTAEYLAEPGAGPIDALDWEYRKRGAGGAWTVAATNPPSDPDHHYQFAAPGEYEIRLTARGPGGTWTTQLLRLVTVAGGSTPEPTPPPEPTGVIPAIGDGEIVQLAVIYDATPPAQAKPDDAYYRDAAYYGLGYARNRTRVDHPTARATYRAAAEADGYYDPTPPGMFANDEVIDVAARFVARYEAIGRFQQQGRRENARDETFYAIVYARARERGKAHEPALQEMERAMAAEAGQPDPYPPPPAPPRGGLVRGDGRRIVDDAGPLVPLGTSFFVALWMLLNGQRDRARAWAQWMKDRRIDYARLFGEVGGATWEDRTIDPADPRYVGALREWLDMAWGEFGVRTHLTVFAGGTGRDPDMVVDRVLEAIDGRHDAIMLIEGANEAFQNFTDREQLRRLVRRIRAAFPGLVATSSYPTPDATSADADIATEIEWHSERQRGDADWRQVRQPWDVRDFPLPTGNGEPPGPQSSEAELNDPVRIATLAAVGFLCGAPAFVVHTGAGVRSGGAADRARGRKADVWEYDNIDAIVEHARNVSSVLPPELPSWRRANGHWPDHPLPADVVWPDDPAFDHGVVRTYGAYDPAGRFVTIPFGVKNYALLTSRRRAHLRIYAVGPQPTLAVEADVEPGSTIRIEGDAGANRAYICVGEPR